MSSQAHIQPTPREAARKLLATLSSRGAEAAHHVSRLGGLPMPERFETALHIADKWGGPLIHSNMLSGACPEQKNTRNHNFEPISIWGVLQHFYQN